jgi:hypothetical protein
MVSRKKALVTQEEVAGEVDALLLSMGTTDEYPAAAAAQTLDDDESSFEGSKKRAAPERSISREELAPSADEDSLWGPKGRK